MTENRWGFFFIVASCKWNICGLTSLNYQWLGWVVTTSRLQKSTRVSFRPSVSMLEMRVPDFMSSFCLQLSGTELAEHALAHVFNQPVVYCCWKAGQRLASCMRSHSCTSFQKKNSKAVGIWTTLSTEINPWGKRVWTWQWFTKLCP